MEEVMKRLPYPADQSINWLSFSGQLEYPPSSKVSILVDFAIPVTNLHKNF